jgi:hypothetical protein
VADEHSESETHDDSESDTHGMNGAGNLWSSLQDKINADKAAFLAGATELEDGGDEKSAAEKTESKAKSKPAETTSDDDDDLDELDDDDDDDTETVEQDESDDEEDPDKDLDEDDDKPADKVEPEVAKRLEKVRKTDKRLREQRESHFRAQEERLQSLEAGIKERWSSRIEAAEEFERLKSKKSDPFGTLKALGYDEADFSEMLREGWALYGEGAKDPKYKDAIARMRKERELHNEIAELKKKHETREKTEAEQKQEAEQRRNVEVFIGKVAKLAAASTKTPLAKQFLTADPERAKLELEVVGGRLAQKLGRMPDPKAVMIEFEKEQRRTLRRLGIDPKTATASSSAQAETKNASTKAGAKPAPKTTPVVEEKKPVNKPLTREEFINRKFD